MPKIPTFVAIAQVTTDDAELDARLDAERPGTEVFLVEVADNNANLPESHVVDMRQAVVRPLITTMAIIKHGYWGPVRNKDRADLAVRHVQSLYKQGTYAGPFNLI